jgi:hypothetical protein
MMFVVDLQFNDKKMRAVVLAIPLDLFCSALLSFFLGLEDVLCGCF